MKKAHPLLVIVGPTASGKSQLALELAHILGSEIISADSRLIYKGMSIGTAKPSEGDRNKIKHHLIDLIDPDQSFSVGEYKRRVEEILNRKSEKDSSVPFIVAGGTGLYVKSILYGLWDGPPADSELRDILSIREKEEKGTLFRELMGVDPISSARIHPNDISKIIRALEVFYLTGKPLSYFHSEHRFQETSRPFLMIGIRIDREALYRRIEERVDEMILRGWIGEVESLVQKGYHARLPSMLSLGYHILCTYLSGVCSLEEAVQQIKKETRHYAKRQMTWFNRDPNVHWLSWDGGYDLIDQVRNKMDQICFRSIGGSCVGS